MKFKFLFLIVLAVQIGYAQSEPLTAEKAASVNKVIALFKAKNIDEIAKTVKYPLNREYPVPNIKNENEFKRRFDEVFDETLINLIANSKTTDWDEVGWRGIMLGSGEVWLDSESGKIKAINYESAAEANHKEALISYEQEHIHSSLKTFESPTYRIETKNYLIRIDYLGEGKYRYASWKAGAGEASKPDLVLKNGVFEASGSGGNHAISFKSGNYAYIIHRTVIGHGDEPEVALEVQKDGKAILNQAGTLIEEF
ncbi:hypothetical protein O4H26_14695 [Aequorivita viscosa]|nr:hypothetical protein [Aequorivita viscosa]